MGSPFRKTLETLRFCKGHLWRSFLLLYLFGEPCFATSQKHWKPFVLQGSALAILALANSASADLALANVALEYVRTTIVHQNGGLRKLNVGWSGAIVD